MYHPLLVPGRFSPFQLVRLDSRLNVLPFSGYLSTSQYGRSIAWGCHSRPSKLILDERWEPTFERGIRPNSDKDPNHEYVTLHDAYIEFRDRNVVILRQIIGEKPIIKNLLVALRVTIPHGLKGIKAIEVYKQGKLETKAVHCDHGLTTNMPDGRTVLTIYAYVRIEDGSNARFYHVFPRDNNLYEVNLKNDCGALRIKHRLIVWDAQRLNSNQCETTREDKPSDQKSSTSTPPPAVSIVTPADDSTHNLREFLKPVREKNSVSRKDLADRLLKTPRKTNRKIDASLIGRIELGYYWPRWDEIEDIANALSISPLILIGKSEPLNPPLQQRPLENVSPPKSVGNTPPALPDMRQLSPNSYFDCLCNLKRECENILKRNELTPEEWRLWRAHQNAISMAFKDYYNPKR